MIIDVTLPRFGVHMYSAYVGVWLKAAGDRVVQGEPLVDIETEKATGTVEAPAAGVLVEILVQSEEEARVGQIIARIRADG